MRIAAAVLLAPLFLAGAYVGGVILLGVVLLLVAQGAREYCRMALPRRPGAFLVVMVLALAAPALRYFLPGESLAPTALVTLGILGSLALGLSAPEPREGARVAALALLGILYVGWLFSFVVALRELPREMAWDAGRTLALGAVPEPARALAGRTTYGAGFTFLLAPILLTWVSDIAAYFAGRAFGGPKLLRRVSPGKTVSGAVGGLVATAGAALLLFAWWPGDLPEVSAAAACLIGLVASVLAQTGDLAESLLKRAFEVKDSSAVIPGHGGVLDRFDALLFTAPAAYALFRAAA